jgi:hypothetical protein
MVLGNCTTVQYGAWYLEVVPVSAVQYGGWYLYLEVLNSMVLSNCTTVQYGAWYLYLEVLYIAWYLYLELQLCREGFLFLPCNN